MRPSMSAVALAALACSPPASGQAAASREQAPGVFRMRLGDFQVTALSDGTASQDLHTVLTNTTTRETDRRLRDAFLTNPVEASINAFLIDTGSRLVLVDTGAGELFGPGTAGKLVESLAAAGYRPDQIDDILITHVHTDHSGGLTVGGRMIFPKATVHAGQADLDFFLTPANAKLGYAPRYWDEARKTVAPYVRAGRVKGFAGRTQLLPGITAIHTPGHTPGHAFYRVESRGETIEFWGDIMHFAAIQFARPTVAVAYDRDPRAAIAQRARQFADASASRRRVAVAHLPFPGIGNIRAEAGGAYRWFPIEYRNRSGTPR